MAPAFSLLSRSGQCRVIYLPLRWYHWDGPLVCELEPGIHYRASYLEPDTFVRHELGEITGDGRVTPRRLVNTADAGDQRDAACLVQRTEPGLGEGRWGHHQQQGRDSSCPQESA